MSLHQSPSQPPQPPKPPSQTSSQTLIVGNWKMHQPPCPLHQYTHLTLSLLPPAHKAVICPPFPYLSLLQQSIQNATSKSEQSTSIDIGAQHMHYELQGSHTGEVSAPMLSDIGVHYVIIAHYEQRNAYAWNHNIIAAQLKNALWHNITPILCIGETQKLSSPSDLKNHLQTTLLPPLQKLYTQKLPPKPEIIVAYEPIWAIGAPSAANEDHIQNALMSIQSIAQEHCFHISTQLYGGSVNAENINAILQLDGACGVLVGRASSHQDQWTKLLQAITTP